MVKAILLWIVYFCCFNIFIVMEKVGGVFFFSIVFWEFCCWVFLFLRVIVWIFFIRLERVGFLIKFFRWLLWVVFINCIFCLVMVWVVKVFNFVLILLMMIIFGIWFFIVLIIIWCCSFGLVICIFWAWSIVGWGMFLFLVILLEVLMIIICLCKLFVSIWVIFCRVVVFFIFGCLSSSNDFFVFIRFWMRLMVLNIVWFIW